MSDLLKRIANYFANEYNGDDKTAPKMELSVDELRYIVSMNVDRCRAEAELRELKNKRYSRTNADRFRSISDEELAGSRVDRIDFYTKSDIPEYIGDFEGIANGIGEAIALEIKWLQSEVEEIR